MHLHCVPCEYGEHVRADAPRPPCPFCGGPMVDGDVMRLKDMQSERDARSSLTAAGYQVGGY